MNSLRRWIAYDWFKLIILLILLALLIFVTQNPITSSAGAETAGTGVPDATVTATSAAVAAAPATATQPAAPSATVAVPSATTAGATASPTAAPTATTVSATATTVSATATTVAATATAPAEPTATLAAQPSPTPSPEAGQPTPTPTPAAAQPATGSGTVDCSKAAPTRLAIGKQALVSANLYERSAAGLDKPVLQTNLPGQKLDIIGGPVCTPYGSGAYQWWNVKTSAGVTGWSAEASLDGKTYFLQPVP